MPMWGEQPSPHGGWRVSQNHAGLSSARPGTQFTTVSPAPTAEPPAPRPPAIHSRKRDFHLMGPMGQVQTTPHCPQARSPRGAAGHHSWCCDFSLGNMNRILHFSDSVKWPLTCHCPPSGWALKDGQTALCCGSAS